MKSSGKTQLRKLINSLTEIVQVLEPDKFGAAIFDQLAVETGAKDYPDPTYTCPLTYRSADRGEVVYGEAFRKIFEFFWGTGVKGDIYEFGTYRGFTARIIATLMKDFECPHTLYLFDSFEGLPPIDSKVDQKSYEVGVNHVWFEGQMKAEKEICLWLYYHLTKIIPRDQLRIIKGYFEQTLLPNMGPTKAALIHLDCDLYESAHFVLEKFLERDMFQDGTVIACDDYNSNRANPLMGERKALEDVFGRQNRFYISPFFPYGWHGMALFVHDRDYMESFEKQIIPN